MSTHPIVQRESSYVCNTGIEQCATEEIISYDNYNSLASYAIMGGFIYFSFFAPLVGYWVRMAIRKSVTHSWHSKNWVDMMNLINWIFHLVIFFTPAIMFPIFWTHNDTSNYILAWYFINILADFIPAFYGVFGLGNFIVALTAGKGTKEYCDQGTCVDNPTYTGSKEAWVSFALWLVIDGLAYFTMFWFGADAVRILAPGGGY